MKWTILFVLLVIVISCGQQNNTQHLQTQIDSLQNKLTKTYKPGFGEFMSSIQVHHEKLWFAGQAQNWKLADFEMGEIKEALDDIKEYNTDRPEAVSLPMIDPAIDSLNSAIAQKNPQLFKSSFVLLTNTCNNCHHATKHEFNVIKIPDTPPFSNQVFKMQ
ncbi:MAG: hypothetical protein P4L41_09350 [Flavipsychrobacter sp.]|nr:hypothetical protein [Flavipsychrobacter sp.]